MRVVPRGYLKKLKNWLFSVRIALLWRKDNRCIRLRIQRKVQAAESRVSRVSGSGYPSVGLRVT